ncbi:hypothetical protein ACLJYM_06275 [Rhizobium giardinii]|uniref:hypothetical protein n=1 Tax=Rhizobium giardinii TaxID=56731 RepID=UPI0039E12536
MTSDMKNAMRSLFFARPKGLMLSDVPKRTIGALRRNGWIWSINGGFGDVYLITDEGVEAYLAA